MKSTKEKQISTKQKASVSGQLTTNQGIPVSDNQDSLTVGERGPVLLQDFHLIEKLAHFDRERIPERVVHAKGAGAHGYFQVKIKSTTVDKIIQRWEAEL